jgi:two-component system, OmpR family, osmolarity sensor histidine kinase EnvZ
VVRAFNDLVHQVSDQTQLRQQLLAGVSHDLRTPLARLRLRVETQCADRLASELTADLLALEHIVDQFLAYVQGDTDSPPSQLRPLVEAVRDVVTPYQDAGQPVLTELEPVQLPVPQLAVRRLLANLIDNALHYGCAPVRVALVQAQQGPELQVWDQGEGLTPDEFARAQQPFVRLGGARPDVGHCGLGLAIATQMARQLGGSLHAIQDPKCGFGIVLRLPTAEKGVTAGHIA